MTTPEINERSYGVVPLRICEGTPYIFIVQHYSGAWMFPKGHAELGETGLQAAGRELAEETGLQVERWLDHDPFIEHYFFWRDDNRMYKEVQYFPACVNGTVSLQQDEIKAGRWESAKDTPFCVTFPEMKHIAQHVYEWLQSLEKLS
jgi:8-oxo-dGTP pyrophosphatase MutT (NUDIX family)